MEEYNRKTLPLIFVVFSAVCLANICLNFFSYQISQLIGNFYVMMVYRLISSIALAGIILWGVIGGKKIGVGTLGRVGGWIYAPLAIIIALLSLYSSYVWMSYGWWDALSVSRVIGITNLVIGLFALAGMILFLFGSRIWLPVKIIVASGEALMYMLTVAITISNYGAVVNNVVALLILLTELVMSIIWLKKIK